MLDVFFFLAGNPCKTKLKTFVLIPVSGLPVYCIINTVIITITKLSNLIGSQLP